MHKNATKSNKTLSKWCKNKHGASKIIDTFETYQYHPNNLWVLSCKQQIIALSKVCNVNNTIILEQKIVVLSLVATSDLQP
jgi:hypothetical protein